MAKMVVRIYVMAVLLCLGCSHDKHAILQWDQSPDRSFREIKHGIPVYEETQVIYRKNGSALARVTLASPSIVAVATEPMRWGYFQFPKIMRTTEDGLLAIWNMQNDAIASYGKTGRDSAVSYDGGKTWAKANGQVGEALVLPSGDQLAIYRPVAPEVSRLALPPSLVTRRVYQGAKSDPFTFYRVSQLPENLQGVYLQRLPKGEKKWTITHEILNDPQAVRYSRSGLFPVMWAGDIKLMPDGSLIAGIYPGFMEEADGTIKPSGTFFYTSTDEGNTWDVLSRIPYEPDTTLDVNGGKREVLGFTEPAFEVLSDGTLLCVQRTTDGMGDSPMYISRSADAGVSWTKPEVIAPSGVLPRLLQLQNGVIALAAGRPGVQLRLSFDGGREWTDPFEMLSWEGEGRPSCGYTNLLATGPDTFLIIYSDFHFKNEQGEDRKAIKVRQITVKPQ